MDKHCTQKAIDGDVALLTQRFITKLSKHYPHDTCHIYFTNNEANEYNTEKLNKIRSILYSIHLVGYCPKIYYQELQLMELLITPTFMMF